MHYCLLDIDIILEPLLELIINVHINKIGNIFKSYKVLPIIFTKPTIVDLLYLVPTKLNNLKTLYFI